jgi:hypothetical protein
VPCTAANAEKEEPAGTLTQFEEQICGPLDSRLIDKPQDLCGFLNVLSDVVHAIHLL